MKVRKPKKSNKKAAPNAKSAVNLTLSESTRIMGDKLAAADCNGTFRRPSLSNLVEKLIVDAAEKSGIAKEKQAA